jgi:hypothetical protein
MDAADLVRVAALVLWLVLGGYYLLSSAELAAKPRRGTALRLHRRGYQGLGLLFLLLAIGQAVALATE